MGVVMVGMVIVGMVMVGGLNCSVIVQCSSFVCGVESCLWEEIWTGGEKW